MHVLAALALAAVPIHPGPAHFARAVDNPWFPLRPGTVFVYRGSKEGEPARETVRVLRRRCRIEGVRCTAVRDLAYVAGRLEERTTDYFAQDERGAVWYFGEETAELDAHGKVTSTEGTWRSGVHGARAGEQLHEAVLQVLHLGPGVGGQRQHDGRRVHLPRVDLGLRPSESGAPEQVGDVGGWRGQDVLLGTPQGRVTD